MDSKVYKKCELIIRQFMELDDPTPELTDRFHEWLFNGQYCLEKNVIIRNLFYDVVNGDSVPVHSENGFCQAK